MSKYKLSFMIKFFSIVLISVSILWTGIPTVSAKVDGQAGGAGQGAGAPSKPASTAGNEEYISALSRTIFK